MTSVTIVFGKLRPRSIGAFRRGRRAGSTPLAPSRFAPPPRGEPDKLGPACFACSLASQCGGALARKALSSKSKRGWPAAIMSWFMSRTGAPFPRRGADVTAHARLGQRDRIAYRLHAVCAFSLPRVLHIHSGLRVGVEPLRRGAVTRFAADAGQAFLREKRRIARSPPADWYDRRDRPTRPISPYPAP